MALDVNHLKSENIFFSVEVCTLLWNFSFDLISIDLVTYGTDYCIRITQQQ